MSLKCGHFIPKDPRMGRISHVGPRVTDGPTKIS